MDDFEQSDLEKETDDFHITSYQNVIHYQDRNNAFIFISYKVVKCGIFSLVSVIKPGGRMTEIFSVGL